MLAFWSLECKASSAIDLYKFYKKELIVEIPEEVTNKIKSYDNAKRYAQMYTYVVNSEYDKAAIELRLETINREISKISTQLISGYNISQHVLYQLESEYMSLVEQRDNILKSMETYDVNVESVAIEEVPKYSEYKEALQIRNDILSKCEIGTVSNLGIPVQSAAIHVGFDEQYAIYKVIDNTGVLSMFNGIVESIDDGVVKINNHNNIVTYIKNLSSIDVKVGDTVYQHQRIGYSDGMFIKFALELDGEFQDLSLLLNEEF